MAVPIAKVEEALRAAHGNCAKAAELLTAQGWPIKRGAVWDRLNRSVRLQRAVAEVETTTREYALSGIASLIRRGDGPTIRWFAERKIEGFGNRMKIAPSHEAGAVFTLELLPAEAALRVHGKKVG